MASRAALMVTGAAALSLDESHVLFKTLVMHLPVGYLYTAARFVRRSMHDDQHSCP